MRRRHVGAVVAALSTTASVAWADGTWGLSQEAVPSSKPWDKPANVRWTSADGKTSAAGDAVLSYKWQSPFKLISYGAQQDAFSAGVYWHRNTDRPKEINDRGGKLSYTATIAGGAGEPSGHEVSALVKVGKKLIIKRDNAGNELSRGDQKTDTELLFFSGFYQWAIKSLEGPNTDPIKPSRDQTFFVDYKAGLYSDRGYGPKTDNGRLSGGQVGFTLHWLPLGLDAPSNTFGQFTIIPQLYAGAQVQRDVAQSGDRTKETYKLYTAGISIDFGKFSKTYGGVVPSLSLERTVGADLLDGRSKSGLTQLLFGLTF